jgi:hypothetical protein
MGSKSLMATNDFKPFATGVGANVTPQPDWEDLPALLNGFSSGKASSDQVNKALRQSTTIGALIGHYIANSGPDALDDGDIDTLVSNFTKAVQVQAFGAYPVGAPIPWPTAVPPDGFLAMTGQSFSATTYPLLALAYPALVLPDMRAEFVRGWDNARGIDAGRVLLSAQGDAIRNITGAITPTTNDVNTSYIPVHSPSGAITSRATYVTAALTTGGGSITRPAGISFDASLVVPTATENRPRNRSFNYIVRAA